MAEDFLAGGLKGIGGGNAGGPKKSTRTPRPIKPPGVYVNGKAVAKAVRQGTAAPAPPLPPPQQQASLGIEPDALEEFKALAAAGGSPQYAEYLDFSVATRRGLEQELDTVLNALDAANRRQADLHARSANSQSNASGDGYSENDAARGNGDQELLTLLEARNADLETQLTQVWDELLVMDEGQKRLSRGVDDAERGALAAQDRASKEIAKLRSELSGYKEEVKATHSELEAARGAASALHEQVDALTQKLSMEEASKKALKQQLEKVQRAAASDAKRAQQAAQAADQAGQSSGDRAGLRRRLRRALQLRVCNGTAAVFGMYCQVRWLQMRLHAAQTGNNSSGSSNNRSLTSAPGVGSSVLIGSANPLSSAAILLAAAEAPTSAALALRLESSSDAAASGRDGAAAAAAQLGVQRALNAQLLQQVASLRGTIQVYARIRPLHADEAQREAQLAASSGPSQPRGVQALGPLEVGVYDPYHQQWRGFAFDRVWGPDTGQLDLFLELEPLVLAAVDGTSSCVMAYGQTGSGKTHTMHGSGSAAQPQAYGLSYRAVHKVFDLLAYHAETHAQGGHRFRSSVRVAMLEVYNDEVRDLLAPSSSSSKRSSSSSGALPVLDVRQSPEGDVVVPGLVWQHAPHVDAALAIFDAGHANRATAATLLNSASSRSHMVCIVEVTTSIDGGASTAAKLHLVDLAGSERVKQSEASGQSLKEAQHINKSLAALGDVMEALDQKAKFVPYRNSKLTYLLQGCLGQSQCRTALVVTCCPTAHTAEESNFTLQFGARCRRVVMGSGSGGSGSGSSGGGGLTALDRKNLEEALRSSRAEGKTLAATNAKLLEANKGSSSSSGEVKQLQAEKAELRAALSQLRRELAEKDHHQHASSRTADSSPSSSSSSSARPPPPPSRADAQAAQMAAMEGPELSGKWAPKAPSPSGGSTTARPSSASRRQPSPVGSVGRSTRHHSGSTAPNSSASSLESTGGGADLGSGSSRSNSATRRLPVPAAASSSGLRRANSGSGAVLSYTQSVAAAQNARREATAAAAAASSPPHGDRSGDAGGSNSPPAIASASSIRSFMRLRQSGRSDSTDSVGGTGGGAASSSSNTGGSSSSSSGGGVAVRRVGSSRERSSTNSSAGDGGPAARVRSSSGSAAVERSSSAAAAAASSSSSLGVPGPVRRPTTREAMSREGSPVRQITSRLAPPVPRARGSSPNSSLGRSARREGSPAASVNRSSSGSSSAGAALGASGGEAPRRSSSTSRFFGRAAVPPSVEPPDQAGASGGGPSALRSSLLRPRGEGTPERGRHSSGSGGSSSSSSGGGVSSSVGANSGEGGGEDTPASRRAEAAKKHAARMQAVRASSGKGRWGNSV